PREPSCPCRQLYRSDHLPCLTGGGNDCSGPLAVLDRSHQLSGDAGSHSTSQPSKLHLESAVGSKFLPRSLWCDDSGAALHFSARLFESASSAAAPGLLGCLSVRAGRHNSSCQTAPGTGV